jgi:hypothetical protein
MVIPKETARSQKLLCRTATPGRSECSSSRSTCARLSCEAAAMIPNVKITAADPNFLAIEDLHTAMLKPVSDH